MIQLNFSPFPELRTARLLLRKLTTEDTPVIFFLRSDENVLKYLGRDPIAAEAEAIEFINKINAAITANESILWGICLLDKPGELIGTICFWNIRPEHFRSQTGYVLHPTYWGKGYMNEALDAILDYGFNTIQLHSVEAQLSPDNTASLNLLDRAGFTREGYFREDYYFNGLFLDTLAYSILKQDWEFHKHRTADGTKRGIAN